MIGIRRSVVYRTVPSIFAVGVLSLALSGCSDEVSVSPEQQEAGRKSKAEALKGLTSPKDATETTHKARPGRSAGTRGTRAGAGLIVYFEPAFFFG